MPDRYAKYYLSHAFYSIMLFFASLNAEKDPDRLHLSPDPLYFYPFYPSGRDYRSYAAYSSSGKNFSITSVTPS